jgi:hypothetical protein
MKKFICLIVLALAVLMTIPQFTHADGRRFGGGYHGHGNRHGRAHSGFHFYWSAPLVLGSWWYPYNGHYSPPSVVVPAPSPPVFVQPEPQPQNYWYYCQDPQGYYPYVQNCPGGWFKVVPEAPKQ